MGIIVDPFLDSTLEQRLSKEAGRLHIRSGERVNKRREQRGMLNQHLSEK
jgi:hypothetical protein